MKKRIKQLEADMADLLHMVYDLHNNTFADKEGPEPDPNAPEPIHVGAVPCFCDFCGPFPEDPQRVIFSSVTGKQICENCIGVMGTILKERRKNSSEVHTVMN